MAADFRGHPMFPSTGFNAPTRFEGPPASTVMAYPPYAMRIEAGARAAAALDAVDPVDRHWVG